jgi:hypothetical protein
MQKSVIVGVGIGLLVLAFLGGSWFANQSQTSASGALPGGSQPGTATRAGDAATERSAIATLPADAASGSNHSLPSGAKGESTSTVAPQSAPPPWARAAATPTDNSKRLTPEERHAIHAKVREQVNALLAKGSKVSLADTEAFIDAVEKTGKGVFEPDYFDSMREIIQYSRTTQKLSQELGVIAGSTAPRDIARKKELLVELKEAGNQINSRVALMQSRARETVQAVGQ